MSILLFDKNHICFQETGQTQINCTVKDGSWKFDMSDLERREILPYIICRENKGCNQLHN